VLREAAESPNSFVALSPWDERIETSRYTLCMSAAELSNTVQRQRFAREEIDEVLREVRSELRSRGRTRTQWEIGSAAEPEDLVAQLLRRGLVRDSEPFAVALALRTAPPPPPDCLVVRRVQTDEEYIAAKVVQFEAFGTPAEEIADRLATMPGRWREAPQIVHAVWLEGEIVGSGTCSWTPHGLALFGGATLPRARGRGVYRALIDARWREATSGDARASASTDAPALITQAGAMSRPILERLGFQPVGRVDMLLDEFGDGESGSETCDP
jgi:GNAT superfamily N-acetyltransferase